MLLWGAWWPVVLLLDLVNLGDSNPEVVGAAIEGALLASLNLLFYFVKPREGGGKLTS